MGKVVLDITISLDEFIAGPGDEFDPLHNLMVASERGNIASQYLRAGLLDEINIRLTPMFPARIFDHSTLWARKSCIFDSAS